MRLQLVNPNAALLEQALNIHKLSFIGAELAPTNMFLHRCKTDFFFADLNNETMRGYALVEDRQPNWLLWEIAVAPSYRGQHVADGLLETVENTGRDVGEYGIELTVRVDNTPAFNLYDSRGYQVIRRLRNYYLGGVDGFLMRRDLC